MGSNGNRKGSKRKVGRPKNKMKKIDDLVKQSEEIVTCSGAIVKDAFQEDRRSVLDLDEIVREHMKKMSELGGKNGKEICIVSSDDDDGDDQNHEYEPKVKEIIVGLDDNDDDQSIGHEWDEKEKGQICEKHEEYFQVEGQSSPKRRKKSAIQKDDEEIGKILSRGRSNMEKGKDGLISP